MLLSVAALALLPVAVNAQAPGALARQLTFEIEHRGTAPAGWLVNPPGSAVIDSTTKRSGKWAARIVRTANDASEFNGITMALPLNVTGDSIVLRAHLRTESVTGFVSVWLREDGASPAIEFESSEPRQVKGTNDWHEHMVTVPIRPEGSRLLFGVLVTGTGTVWVDDIELLADGKPLQDAPKLQRPLTVLDTDTAFNAGSRIRINALSPAQVENLVTLGLVWGFLKYHHPAIVSGSHHWDFDLYRVMPNVLAATDRASANAVLSAWISSLGPVAPCATCAALNPDGLHFAPELSWLTDEARLGAALSQQLLAIHANRPADGKQFYVSHVPDVGNPEFRNELAYARLSLPDAGAQLLALYRIWNIVQYWFPYRDVIGESWERVLREFVPGIALATTKQEYERQLMAVIARVHDTHANLWSSLAVRPPVGACQLPITLRFVGADPVVTQGGVGFERGDVITSLDGVSVAQLVADWSPYYAASNVPTRRRDIARAMFRGACVETRVGVRRGRQTLTVNATRVTPASVTNGAPTQDLPGETFRMLSDDVAYLKLSTIAVADIPRYINAAARTKGLIIDIRNYPSDFVVFALGQHLVSTPTPFVRFTQGDLSNPGAFRWSSPIDLVPSSLRYEGKVIILLDEVSQSQAEYTAMAFRSAPGARVVGSTTAGADGNVSPIPLPGGLQTMISGIGVFYPDKRPTQRVGIIPDVEISPSIDGIRAGRDEVLEAGIREILGKEIPLTEIRKLIPSAGATP
jgi:C-terminal processing protease CtpA/Prc